MTTEPTAPGPDAYEYSYLSGAMGGADLVVALNDLAAEGWELVSSHGSGQPVGAGTTTVLIRRRIEPLDPPDAEPGWFPDPSGRWDRRYWNGRAWTFHVAREADKSRHRDPPTRHAPTGDLLQ